MNNMRNITYSMRVPHQTQILIESEKTDINFSQSTLFNFKNFSFKATGQIKV